MLTELYIAAIILFPIFSIFAVVAFIDEVIFEKFPAVADAFDRVFDFLFER